MEFETRLESACMKLCEMDLHHGRPDPVSTVCAFHGWKALPLQRPPSERISGIGEAGVKYMLADGGLAAINPLLLGRASLSQVSLIIQSVYPIWENLRLTACA